jgi:hypothetical protein
VAYGAALERRFGGNSIEVKNASGILQGDFSDLKLASSKKIAGPPKVGQIPD